MPKLEPTPKKDKEGDRSNKHKQEFDSGEQLEIDLGIEGNRCEAVHEAINKFVVYEKFAEMTHKYDA